MSQAIGAGQAREARPAEAAGHPYWSDFWFAAFVAMAAVSMQFTLQSKSVIIYLAAVGYLIFRSWEASVLAVGRWLPALSLAFLALLSMFWSDAPGLSFRLGGMLLLSLAGAIIIADRLSPTQFLGAAFCGLMIVVLGSLIFPRYQISTSGLALMGLTGNKNQIGFFSMAGALVATAVALDRGQPALLRWAALACTPASLVALYLSKSVGSWLSGAMGFGLLIGLTVMHALSPRGRVLALVAALMLAVPTVINLDTLKEAAVDFQVDVLKKDRTLTGRTYLWERAGPIIAQRPALGQGFGAFWRQGQLDAEGLWRYAGIDNRGGFNFHNEYVDMAVALGYTGVAILILTMIGLGLPLFMRALFAPTIPIACFAAVVAPMYIRTTAETGMISYWSIGTTLLFAGGIYGRRGAFRRLKSGAATGVPAGRAPAPAE